MARPLPLPLSQRRGDLVLIAFFLLNLLVITYVVDLEQLVIADPSHVTYPLWPPRFAVDADHWWGRAFDARIPTMAPARCAALIVRAAAARNRETVLTLEGKLLTRLYSLVPGPLDRQLACLSRLYERPAQDMRRADDQ